MAPNSSALPGQTRPRLAGRSHLGLALGRALARDHLDRQVIHSRIAGGQGADRVAGRQIHVLVDGGIHRAVEQELAPKLSQRFRSFCPNFRTCAGSCGQGDEWSCRGMPNAILINVGDSASNSACERNDRPLKNRKHRILCRGISLESHLLSPFLFLAPIQIACHSLVARPR